MSEYKKLMVEYGKVVAIEKELETLKEQINNENKRLKKKVNTLLDKINKATFLKRLKYLITRKL